MGIEVREATPARWDDVVAVLGARDAGPGACWCQRFLRPADPDHRALLRDEIRAAAVPVGLVAEVDGGAAGWTRVVPRSTLPGVVGNRALQRTLEPDAAAWWVTCVVVRVPFRGRGVGAALLRAAVLHAGRHGASVLEGHPVDVAASTGSPSPSALFTGTRSMFLAAGFAEVARTAPARPVMRVRFGGP